ncbi:TPA: hypothetical protein PJH31_000751 [Enterococcus faecalis]|nr:hypothetical protein [Enterococcus faecalis]HDH7716279.1 hypothetical protein [Enterococcus faecalis]HDH7719373.1 hypothetical protein [Enterococcus faecalis]HDH7722303.1 hypothetical protein [Enterococcus faecalis]
MNEIVEGVTYKEYLLTLIRIITFLDYLGKDHKKNTSQERIVLYDFFLRYPEFLDIRKIEDFDTKYSYFHWKPNYRLYAAVLTDAQARCLVKYKTESRSYIPTQLGSEFIRGMSNSYIGNLIETSKYVEKNICKLSNKAINEKISLILLNSRGVK